MAFLVGGANSAADTGYNIANSLRSNQPDAAYLSFAVSSPNTDIFTISMWVKTSLISSGSTTFFEIGKALTGEIGDYTTFTGHLDVDGRSQFDAYDGVANGYSIRWGTPPATVLRDPAAWYHIVMRMDSSQAVLDNRARLYLNGEDISSRMTKTVDPDQNDDYFNATGSSVYFPGGVSYTGANTKWNGHIAECAYIDGTSYAASTFAETDEDSGIWKPKDFKDDVTFGTNGLYLEFKQSGTNQDSSGLGADTSGNDNHMAVTNFVATDQTTDTPTNNFATFNPLMYYPAIVSGTITVLAFSEGNTKVTGSSSGTGFTPAIGSIGVSNGKWYYEFYTSTDDSGTKVGGAMDNDFIANGDKDIHEAFYGVRASNGTFYYNDSTNESLSNATEWKDNGDILSVALNLDDMEISFSTNGASYTAAQSITGNTATSGTLHPAIYLADDEIVTVNFGNPNWVLSSGNADANGYGNFEYAPPNGYYALCTKNLAEFG